MHYFYIFLIGIAIFLADFFSKFFVHHNLPYANSYTHYPFGGIGVFKNFLGIQFSINHAINKGAAWGILSDWQEYLVYLRIALIVGLIIYVVFFNKKRTWDIPLVFIIAGATGNVTDYFLYGHVVDMLHFNLWGYDFPVFNLADSAIFIGIASLFLLTFLEDRKKSKASAK